MLNYAIHVVLAAKIEKHLYSQKKKILNQPVTHPHNVPSKKAQPIKPFMWSSSHVIFLMPYIWNFERRKNKLNKSFNNEPLLVSYPLKNPQQEKKLCLQMIIYHT